MKLKNKVNITCIVNDGKGNETKIEIENSNKLKQHNFDMVIRWLMTESKKHPNYYL